MISKEPEYIKLCTLPRNYIMPKDNDIEKEVVVGQCGRKLTQTMINRNECPSCHRSFRPEEPKRKDNENKRRLKRMDND